MTEYKAGLHKKISSIFDGVPLQGQGQNHNEADTQLPPYPANQNQNARQIPKAPPTSNHQTQTQEPVKKLYKDTAEKRHKAFAGFNSRLKGRFLKLYQPLKEKLLPSLPGVNPARQIALLVLIPVLFIVLIFVFVRVFGSGSAVKRQAPKDSTSSSAVKDSHKVEWKLPEPYSAQLRDPMRIGPSTSRGPAGSNSSGYGAWLNGGKIILRGIVHSKDKASAIVGMQIVQEGDKIGDITIVKINKNSVDFEKNGQRKSLKVGQSWFLSD